MAPKRLLALAVSFLAIAAFASGGMSAEPAKAPEGSPPSGAYPAPPHRELIVPPGTLPSCHAPGIVELPDGELFAVWYVNWHPSSIILGSRKPAGAGRWSAPFIVQRSRDRSAKNPVLYLGQDGKLTLFWADEIRLLKLVKDTVLMKTSADNGRTWSAPRDIGLPWFLPKSHPVRLDDGRIVLPVYTDLITSSAVAVSKDGGSAWAGPRFILFLFGIQPAVIQRSDSTLFALMRCGMPPRLAWQASSGDRGDSWTDRRYSPINNPGTSIDMIKLRNGHVVLAFNDSKRDLSELSLALSLDEGRTWPYRRKVESGLRTPNTYPSMIQDRSGLIHVVYSFNGRRSVAHFVTDEEWITGRSGRGSEYGAAASGMD